MNVVRAALEAVQCGIEIKYCLNNMCGPGNSVGVATRNGLDGPGIDSRCKQLDKTINSNCVSQPVLAATYLY